MFQTDDNPIYATSKNYQQIRELADKLQRRGYVITILMPSPDVWALEAVRPCAS